jgi:hypothetical protein
LPVGTTRRFGSPLRFDRTLRFGLHSSGAVSRGARFGLLTRDFERRCALCFELGALCAFRHFGSSGGLGLLF